MATRQLSLEMMLDKSLMKRKKVQLTPEEKRQISIQRAVELESRIKDYLEARTKIPVGRELEDRIARQRAKILKLLGGTEADWQDWKWQMANRITDVELLSEVLELSEREAEEIRAVGEKFRWAISPYYLSIIDPADSADPVRLQAIPQWPELEPGSGEDDPMGEEFTNPAPRITRRYPDRLIINVTNVCAMYCRHCQRRRNIGETDRHSPTDDLQAALDYIRQHPEIRDVLVTGGDSLMLSDEKIDWLLTELDNIPHVEIKRLGTRVLVTLPQRITKELCDILAKHPPLYLNTQFNHPQELTKEAVEAAERLVKAGVVLGNQAVLLKNINNDKHVMKKLNHELLKARIRPYYIFHAKEVIGTRHFVTPIEDGLEIMEHLRGYTSGLAIPTYIINAPKGYGKTPMLPEYLVSTERDKVYIRTWEKRIMEYPNHRSN